MHTDDEHAEDLGAILESIRRMSARELDRLQAAIDARRGEVQQSLVVERRGHRDGLLQLEYRQNPSGALRGPYWYFHHRKDGKQRTIYVGKTREPNRIVDQKLKA